MSLKLRARIHILLFALLVLISLFITSIISYFLFYCTKPVVFNSPPQTLKEVYKPGETLFYSADYCKYTDTSFILYRSWVDGIVYTMPPVHSAGRRIGGCYESYHPVTVPNLPTGIYSLKLTYVYLVGPFLERTVRTSTNSFKITNEK